MMNTMDMMSMMDTYIFCPNNKIMLDVALCYLVTASRDQLLEHYQRFLRGWV